MKPTTTTKYAIDTNIVVYSQDMSDLRKRTIAKELLEAHPIISEQVVSEYLNVMRRLLPVGKAELMTMCVEWVRRCEFYPITRATLESAAGLISRYDLQLFDSIIVASALQAGCIILYSEDMNHRMVVEERLTIINPFH